MKKIKVLYVLPHFYPHIGGGEQAFLDTMLALIEEKNIDVRVVTSASGGIKGQHSYLNIDIFSYNWSMFCGHPIVNKKDLVEHINWADIVHVGVYSPVIPTVSMCKKLNKPCIVTAHESLNEKWHWVEKNYIKALLFRIYEYFNVNVKCECFHVPSDATKKDLLENNKKANVKRIYWISENTIDTTPKLNKKFMETFNVKKGQKTFLYYGRPGQTKGIFVYEDAIKKLVCKLTDQERKNIKFCFILSKDPIKGLEQFKKTMYKNNLDDIISINTETKRKDLLEYIKCADYVVVPSITEGFGLSAIEACEREKKLIHSSGGSLPEVTYGYCCEFKNRNSDDLSEKLYKIIKGKDIFKHKSKKDFSKKTIVNEFYDMYVEILKKYEQK